MKFTPYSYSKISTYNSCPKKFHFQYVLKVGDVQMDSPALAKGRCVHSIFEYSGVVSEEVKNSEYYQISRDIYEKFLQSDLKHYVLTDKPKFAEQKIALNIKLQPCEFRDKDVLFKGIVDQVLVNNDLYLNDFKTGKYVDERYQSYEQLLFYAVYFFIKHENIQNIYISYLYVEHNLENKMLLERKYLDNYKKMLLSNIINIENEQNFNSNITKLCDYCGFNQICEDYLLSKAGI